MQWYEFCGAAKCSLDVFAQSTPKRLAERYAKFNPNAEPLTSRDVLIMFQEWDERPRAEVTVRTGRLPR